MIVTSNLPRNTNAGDVAGDVVIPALINIHYGIAL